MTSTSLWCVMTIELRDTVFINASPECVWNWLERMPEYFLDWHPDHISCRWIRGDGFEPGAVIEVVEFLHGKKHRLRMQATEVDPGRSVEYRILPGLGGSFRVSRDGAKTAFTATIRMGFDWPLAGSLIDWVLLRSIGHRIDCIRNHQHEEGINLKSLIESRARKI